MRKEQFLKFDKSKVYCESCKRTLPVEYFSYSYIRKDGTAQRCKFCDWKHRHGGTPLIDGYELSTIETAIEFVVFNKSIYVNDLADIINLNINDTINLLRSLKIGNKQLFIKLECNNCGCEVDRQLSAYKENSNTFCSYDCYWKYKKAHTPIGEENKDYKRVHTVCANCGKPLDVIPFDYNSQNAFGDKHNFCSQQCYWDFRKKYYVGEKASMYGRTMSDEQREIKRIQIIESNKSADRLNSGIQLIVNDILDKNDIKYIREYNIKYYAIDNYLPDYNLMIEVMGDFWHASPLKYNNDKHLIIQRQQRGVLNDKRKHSFVLNKYNIEILYLWENDVNNRPYLCELLIKLYIKNNGVLPNYHSFNWSINEGEIVLNADLIIPYQDMSTNEYKNLLSSNTV